MEEIYTSVYGAKKHIEKGDLKIMIGVDNWPIEQVSIVDPRK